MLQVLFDLLVCFCKPIDLVQRDCEEGFNCRKLFQSEIACLFQELVMFQKERVIARRKHNVLPHQTSFQRLVISIQSNEKRSKLCIDLERLYFAGVIMM